MDYIIQRIWDVYNIFNKHEQDSKRVQSKLLEGSQLERQNYVPSGSYTFSREQYNIRNTQRIDFDKEIDYNEIDIF